MNDIQLAELCELIASWLYGKKADTLPAAEQYEDTADALADLGDMLRGL